MESKLEFLKNLWKENFCPDVFYETEEIYNSMQNGTPLTGVDPCKCGAPAVIYDGSFYRGTFLCDDCKFEAMTRKID